MCDVISVRFSHHALALFGKKNASLAQGRLVIHAIYRRRVISSFDPHGKVFVVGLSRHRRPLPPPIPFPGLSLRDKANQSKPFAFRRNCTRREIGIISNFYDQWVHVCADFHETGNRSTLEKKKVLHPWEGLSISRETTWAIRKLQPVSLASLNAAPKGQFHTHNVRDVKASSIRTYENMYPGKTIRS